MLLIDDVIAMGCIMRAGYHRVEQLGAARRLRRGIADPVTWYLTQY